VTELDGLEASGLLGLVTKASSEDGGRWPM
jgi:hypothetical protein